MEAAKSNFLIVKGMQTEEAAGTGSSSMERKDRQMDRRKDGNSSKKTGDFCFVLP